MHKWMDEQIAAGLDIRDSVARDKAKAFALEIGFPLERFKASAKWLDKVRDSMMAFAHLSSRTVERLRGNSTRLPCTCMATTLTCRTL